MNLKISILQYHSIPGNIQYNFEKLKDFYLNSLEKNPDLDIIITGELSLSGYTSLDEFYNQQYILELQAAINNLKKLTYNKKTAIIFGEIFLDKDNILYNAAYVISEGEIKYIIKKQRLVDYDVFNETRYFNRGTSGNNIVEINGIKLAILVCEDLWHKDIITELKNYDFNAIITLNASPYYKEKMHQRLEVAFYAVKELNRPLIYTNIVGGTDGVVFDGRSFVIDKNSNILNIMEFLKEQYCTYSLENLDIKVVDNSNIFIQSTVHFESGRLTLSEGVAQEFYEVIQQGFQDFVSDNNFKGVIIGLSGGIDSALSATIACDTLGSDRVIAVSMPFLYTSDLSKNIIKKISDNLDISILEVPIEEIYNKYVNINISNRNESIPMFSNIAKQNLQSRIRANILMAISNSYNGYVVLCNGNKTELATGYFTLYGDSCGAFNLIKDLFKTEVYSLAKWRNVNKSRFSVIKKLNLIPEECINRAPSAELDFNQTDESDLLPYPLLDSILKDIIENNIPYNNLIKIYLQKDVNQVFKFLKSSEYKRKQGTIGIKLKNKGFGKEWQYPITNGFNYNERNN